MKRNTVAIIVIIFTWIVYYLLLFIMVGWKCQVWHFFPSGVVMFIGTGIYFQIYKELLRELRREVKSELLYYVRQGLHRAEREYYQEIKPAPSMRKKQVEQNY